MATPSPTTVDDDSCSRFLSVVSPNSRPRRAGVVDLAIGQLRPRVERSARTINHRLSVLASFFGFLVERDTDLGRGAWAGRASPVPQRHTDELAHGMPGGGSAPVRRGRAELRRREPRQLPRDLDPVLMEMLIAGATSRRDHAILTLLAPHGSAHRRLER